MSRRHIHHRAFTLVELLVVIGIIALLIAMLLPALSGARQQSKTIACQANLKSVFGFMLMYSNDNRGALYPHGLGAGVSKQRRWPNFVFKPAVWNPPVMLCPADEDPREEHSYAINDHVHDEKIKFGLTKGVNSSYIILMGEKKTSQPDYYMDADEGDFVRIVEAFRHGLNRGSNYLYLDGHVETKIILDFKAALDPWNPKTATLPGEDEGPREGE